MFQDFFTSHIDLLSLFSFLFPFLSFLYDICNYTLFQPITLGIKFYFIKIFLQYKSGNSIESKGTTLFIQYQKAPCFRKVLPLTFIFNQGKQPHIPDWLELSFFVKFLHIIRRIRGYFIINKSRLYNS